MLDKLEFHVSGINRLSDRTEITGYVYRLVDGGLDLSLNQKYIRIKVQDVSLSIPAGSTKAQIITQLKAKLQEIDDRDTLGILPQDFIANL